MENIHKDIDLKQFCEHLLDKTEQVAWKEAILGQLKLVNSVNTKKLKQKELKHIYRDAVCSIKDQLKNNDNKNYQNQVLPISKILSWKGGGAKWVIDQLLPQNGIAILSGDPANFKTWSTLHFAICIAEGKSVYNYFQTIKSNVLIIDEEDGISLLQQRLKILSADGHSKIYFKVMSGFKIQQENQLIELDKTIKKYKIKVIIIDSLVRIHDGDENSSNDTKKVFEVCRRLNTMGVTILINHHHRKNSGMGYGNNSDLMRGSSDILASLDCHMQIKHKDGQLIITQTKNRVSQELKPFTVDIKNEDDKMSFNYSGSDDKSKDKHNKAKETIYNIIKEQSDWIDRERIEVLVGGVIGKNAIGLSLVDLVSDGSIISKIEDKGKKLYKNKNDPAF